MAMKKIKINREAISEILVADAEWVSDTEANYDYDDRGGGGG
jgi:hypothetical protein